VTKPVVVPPTTVGEILDVVKGGVDSLLGKDKNGSKNGNGWGRGGKPGRDD
jgi:hypothetical protein